MKLVSLVENSSCRSDCGCTHGLALYLETERERILFDMGPNALFLENAQVLGVSVEAVSLAVLSHGHYDHGGGLALFCKRNDKAPVYVANAAFVPHAVQKDGGYEDIGLSAAEQGKLQSRLQTHTGRLREDLYLLCAVPGSELRGTASDGLLMQSESGYVPDDFAHEQSLIISEAGRHYLVAGCAHRGIVNILRAGEAVIGGEFDYVVAGFHLHNPGLGIDEPQTLVRAVGEALKARAKTRYITGHCTGTGPYMILQELLGERLACMPAGTVLTI